MPPLQDKSERKRLELWAVAFFEDAARAVLKVESGAAKRHRAHQIDGRKVGLQVVCCVLMLRSVYAIAGFQIAAGIEIHHRSQ